MCISDALMVFPRLHFSTYQSEIIVVTHFSISLIDNFFQNKGLFKFEFILSETVPGL